MLYDKGAFDSENDGWTFYKKSKGNNDFDYTYSTIYHKYKDASKSLFIVDGEYTAHNRDNFGNFLWAATGYTLGFEYLSLKMGAHLNSLVNSESNGYGSQLDSKDDQRSIEEGAYYASKNKFRNMVK